ncbi:Manganese/iron superoxide dismutase [Xylaria sp. CBS 124048]|nr:Manganese/iron superoxide dismutase [Xylaria sp. CBS 124048]
MLRPRLSIPRVGALLRRTTTPFARSLHGVPTLGHFNPEVGVPGLLSAAGFTTAWTDYMNLIMSRLNYITEGTERANYTTLSILKNAAREPSDAALFNYASMAHNNHFFFEQLVNLQTLYEQFPDKAKRDEEGKIVLDPSEKRIPPKLLPELERNFSSIESLRREFLTTAMGMFGPGFVWLVKNVGTTELRILVTYLAGSPYTAAHWRRQGVDWNTSSGEQDMVNSLKNRAQAGAGNSPNQFDRPAPGGTDVVPLLCLNTWEHVWITDYGIAGKDEYIQQWWETIDWEKVHALALPRQQNQFV